jgi:hypothetical protein
MASELGSTSIAVLCHKIIVLRQCSCCNHCGDLLSLSAALQAGADVLQKGGTSLDAVEAAIRLMEDDPLFNAGRGAVFTAEGKNEWMLL